MGMFEYEVGLAWPKTPEELEALSNAFLAGQKKQQDRILSEILGLSNGYENINVSINKLRKIILND